MAVAILLCVLFFWKTVWVEFILIDRSNSMLETYNLDTHILMSYIFCFKIKINPYLRSDLPTRKRYTTIKTPKFSKLMCLIPCFFKVDVSKSGFFVYVNESLLEIYCERLTSYKFTVMNWMSITRTHIMDISNYRLLLIHD